MILVDTVIWIDHFRAANPHLLDLIADERLLIHPFVIGEIALGSLREREAILASLIELPPCVVASPGEVMMLIDVDGLAGTGIGWVDAHLLCSARLTPECLLWTRDRKLRGVAERLGVAF